MCVTETTRRRRDVDVEVLVCVGALRVGMQLGEGVMQVCMLYWKVWKGVEGCGKVWEGVWLCAVRPPFHSNLAHRTNTALMFKQNHWPTTWADKPNARTGVRSVA